MVKTLCGLSQHMKITTMNNTLSKEYSFKPGLLKIKNFIFEQFLVTTTGVNTSWRTFSSGCRIVFFAILLLQKNLTVMNRKNGVKVYMLCHEGTDFFRVVTAMAKHFVTATSNVYQVHLHVRRQLLFVARMRIFEFLKTLSYFDCSIEGIIIM